jgi:hypothetical protein
MKIAQLKLSSVRKKIKRIRKNEYRRRDPESIIKHTHTHTHTHTHLYNVYTNMYMCITR